MRGQYALTLIAFLLVTFGVKLFFSSATTAEAIVRPTKGLGLDVSNMHVNKILPVQEMDDFSFFFIDAQGRREEIGNHR